MRIIFIIYFIIYFVNGMKYINLKYAAFDYNLSGFSPDWRFISGPEGDCFVFLRKLVHRVPG